MYTMINQKFKKYVHTTKAGVFLRTKYGAWHVFLEDTWLRPTIASGRHARATWHRILPTGEG